MKFCWFCDKLVSLEEWGDKLYCPNCGRAYINEPEEWDIFINPIQFIANKTGNLQDNVLFENKEQAAKEEAAKAAMNINCPQDAKTLEQATAAAVAKTKKRLGSKINFDVLENMFNTSEAPDFPKKRKIDSHLVNDNDMPHEGQELEFDDNLENEHQIAEEFEGRGYNLVYDNVETSKFGEDYGYDGF